LQAACQRRGKITGKRVGPGPDDKRAKAPVKIRQKTTNFRKKLQKSASLRLPILPFGASGRKVPPDDKTPQTAPQNRQNFL
jgi:hypothetical protein